MFRRAARLVHTHARALGAHGRHEISETEVLKERIKSLRRQTAHLRSEVKRVEGRIGTVWMVLVTVGVWSLAGLGRRSRPVTPEEAAEGVPE